MKKSIVVAAVVFTMLGACAQNTVQPPPASSADSLISGFEPYCGPIWSVVAQGYRYIPCPPGSTYPGAR